MKRRIILVAAVALSLTACKEQSTDKRAELDKLKKQQAELKVQIEALENELGTDEKVAKKTVVIAPVKTGTFIHTIDVQGKVDGDQSVYFGADMPGTVLKVNVQPGDVVRKGQVLAELDNKVILQSMQELENSREFAKTMYLKQKSLWDQKIGTEIQYLNAKNQLESLDKKMATVNEQLQMTKIKSPIDGTVDQVNVKVGQTAAPGMPSFAVVNSTNLKVKAELAESYAANVKKGDDVIITFPDLGKEVKTKITHASRIINPMNRTFNVEAVLGNSDEIRPNMIALIRVIDYKNEKAITVPASLIQKSNNDEFVFVVNQAGGKATVVKKSIKTGKSYNGVLEIVSGLNEGDKLIVTGYQDLNPGDLVNL